MSTIQVNIPFALTPFHVPTTVAARPVNGNDKPVSRIPRDSQVTEFELAQLEPEQLATLCDEFRKSIFAYARKTDPATVRTKTAAPNKDYFGTDDSIPFADL